MHLCISELGSPSLTSIATLCSCNSTMLRDKEWATVRDTQIHRPLKSCKAVHHMQCPTLLTCIQVEHM